MEKYKEIEVSEIERNMLIRNIALSVGYTVEELQEAFRNLTVETEKKMKEYSLNLLNDFYRLQPKPLELAVEICILENKRKHSKIYLEQIALDRKINILKLKQKRRTKECLEEVQDGTERMK